MIHSISTEFEKKFGSKPELSVAAPGRINLIGEHTDYNHGFVLPAAIDKSINFSIKKRSDKKLVFYAVDLNETFEGSLDSLEKSAISWANYLIGILKELTNSGFSIDYGLEVAFGGDVPLGAGLSSSAALESGFCFALSELFELGLNRKEMALTAQRAEHNFAGVNCGIMDMYASLFGKQNSVIRLDCKHITHEYFPFDFPEYEIVLCNSGVKHNLADSEYNTRRKECEAGVYAFQNINPNIQSLRDVSVEFFTKHKNQLELLVMKRCRYVICELERVNLACLALLNGDLGMFGNYMYKTHWGLANDYEVSCEELDFLVKATESDDEVLGSRMMGGGFGGCTINLVKKAAVDAFIEKQKHEYHKHFNRELDCYVVQLTDGVRII